MYEVQHRWHGLFRACPDERIASPTQTASGPCMHLAEPSELKLVSMSSTETNALANSGSYAEAQYKCFQDSGLHAESSDGCTYIDKLASNMWHTFFRTLILC